MYDAFNETLRSWHNFYFMTGGATAGLLGLMFVAISLGANMVTAASEVEYEAFVTPSVLYFVAVLVICGLMLAPTHEPPILGVILLVGSLIGLSQSVRPILTLIRTARKHGDFVLADWLAQVIGPLVGFGLLVVAAAGFDFAQESLGFTTLWIATILLLLCAIANTWSLMIWIIKHRE